jgi:hypothetical protein
MGLQLGFTNRIVTATLTSSSQDSTFVRDNLKTPQRPFYPWKATVATDSWVVCDFGSATSIDLVGLIHANFATVRIQGHATDSWGSPSYNSGDMTITKNPWNGRYQLVNIPSGFNYRYLRIFIPTQTPVDGASVFSLGGLWAGARVSVGEHFRWGSQITTMHPRQDVSPPHGGWSSRLKLGEPFVRMDVTIPAQTDATQPARNDALDTWLGLQQQMWEAGHFLLFSNLVDDSQGWIMRLTNDPAWTVDAGLSILRAQLEEAMTA